MTERIKARNIHRDKRKATRHQWGVKSAEPIVNPEIEKIEETENLLSRFKRLFTGE